MTSQLDPIISLSRDEAITALYRATDSRLLEALYREAAAFVVLSGGFCLSSLPGCAPKQPGPARHAYIGIDLSGSARANLGAYGLGATAVAERLTPGRDRLSLYRLDRDVREFSDGLADGDTERLLRAILAEKNQPNPKSRTLPERFWKTVADRAASDSGPVIVVLFTDGDNDDLRAASDAAIRTAAQRLADNPRLRGVAVCGARAENWERLRRALAPLDRAGRLRLLAPTEVTPAAVGALAAEMPAP